MTITLPARWRLVLVLAPLLLPSLAAAQSYPSHRITLIVPYSPGSGFDIVARTIGQKLSERWGQPVVIDNKPGASGTLGTDIVANAAPDGHTLLVSGAPLTVYPSLVKSLRFNPATSFTPIGVAATSIVALTVNTALPQAQSGKLRMLAVASSKRSPMAPDVPSLHELGYASLDFDLWFGFLAPANLPGAIVGLWERELAAISAMPDVQESFRKQGLTPAYLDSAETAALIKSEMVRWREVAEKAGIKPE